MTKNENKKNMYKMEKEKIITKRRRGQTNKKKNEKMQTK